MKRSLHIISNILIFLVVLAGFVFVMSYNYIKAASTFLTVSDDKLSHRFVKKIKIDGNFVYVGTADKLNIYNLKDEKVIKVEGLRDNYITAIAYDNNSIWVGTPNGLSMVSKKDYSVKNFDLYDISKKLPDNYVTDIVVDGSQLWIATRRWGVLQFDPTTSRWKGYSVLNGLAGNNVNALALDGQYIWAATDDGLSAYDKSVDFWKSYLPQDGLAFNKVSSIAVDGEFIWAGTMGGGLSRLNKLDDTFQNLNTSAGLVDDNIQCLTIDGKLLWIGTFAGVNKFDKETRQWEMFSAATGLPEDSVGDIAISGNFAWFATDGGGIARMDKVIPEAYLSPLTTYSKAGATVEVLGTSYSYQDISAFILDYKSEILNQYSTVGVSQEASTKILNAKLGSLDVTRLINGTYYLKLTVRDKANNVNVANLPIVVDTVPPSLTLDDIPESVKDPEFVISGRYNEMNLIRITIKNNDEIIGGGEIERVRRAFSLPITLKGGLNKIEVTAEDISLQKTTVVRTTIYDTDKPEFLNVTRPDKPTTAAIKIEGQVKDYSLQRLVLNPGNVEVKFVPEPDKNYIFGFSQTVNLVQGENKYTLDAYDMVGNKTTYEVKPLLYTGGGPVIVMNKSNNKVYESGYVLQGTYGERNLKEIIITNSRMDGYVKAIPDPTKQVFSAKLELQEGENILTAYIVNNNNQKSFDVFNIFYSTEMSKFALTDYNRYTASRKALLTGKFSEPNLKEIVLTPGNIRASVDFKSNTFQVFAPVLKDKNEYQLVLSDKMGGTMKDIVLYFDDTPPVVKMDSVPPVVNASPLIIKGTLEENNFDRMTVSPGNIQGIYNPNDKTFKIQVPLNAGENNLTLTVQDLAKNETVIKIPVKLIPQVTASGGDLVEVPQAGDPELRAQILRLQQEIERLRAEKSVYVPVAVVHTGPRRVALPKEKAVFFAPYDQKEGDTLLELSKYYLGSPSYVSLISALNDVLDPTIINRRKSLLMPSKSMVQLLNQYSIFDAEMQAVNAIAMSYNALGSKANLNDYFQKFMEFASMNRSVQAGAGTSAVFGDVMVVLVKGSSGNLAAYRNVKNSKKYKNVVIGQIGQSSVVYTIL